VPAELEETWIDEELTTEPQTTPGAPDVMLTTVSGRLFSGSVSFAVTFTVLVSEQLNDALSVLATGG
jgi:hypothetical protein